MIHNFLLLIAVAGLTVPQITPKQVTDTSVAKATQPPTPQSPPPTSQKPKPAVVVLGTDSVLTRDSIRVILERDFDFGDRIKVIFLDTASRARLTPPLGRSPEYHLFDSFKTSYIVRPVRTKTGLRVALYNVPQRKYIRAFAYTVPMLPGDSLPDNVVNETVLQRQARLGLHKIADDIELIITGVRGISATRIAYVHNNYLRMVDSDGASDHTITTEGEVLSPAWHPRGTSIVYSHLGDAGTQIAQLNFTTGKSTFLNATPRGLNITPVYTPRGDSIVYSTSGARGSRLVVASAKVSATNRARQIPSGKDVDRASPSFRNDGGRIAFVASLPSFPQIYTMRRNGTDVRRLVPYIPPRRNDRTAPDWSPNGRYIAYQQQNRKFQIWTIRLSDSLITQLTTTAENEDPSWAPDSRHMVITSTRGVSKELWVLDVQTGRMRQLTHSPGARLSAWSPRLK